MNLLIEHRLKKGERMKKILSQDCVSKRVKQLYKGEESYHVGIWITDLDEICSCLLNTASFKNLEDALVAFN